MLEECKKDSPRNLNYPGHSLSEPFLEEDGCFWPICNKRKDHLFQALNIGNVEAQILFFVAEKIFL